MDWSALGKRVAQAAPILGGAIGPGGAAVGGLVASLFGVENDPDAINQALDSDPEAAIKLRELENEHRRELIRLQLEAETARHAQINKTMRAELATEDRYKSYWRPTFGYLAALTWTVQGLALVYAIVADPAEAPRIIEAIGSLGFMWSVALGVLGIQIHARSRDKQTAAGQQPTGLLGSFAQRLQGGDK